MPEKLQKSRALKNSIAFAMGQFISFIEHGTVFYFGTVFFQNESYAQRADMYKSQIAVIYAAFGVGFASQFMPDVGKCREAGKYLIRML